MSAEVMSTKSKRILRRDKARNFRSVQQATKYFKKLSFPIEVKREWKESVVDLSLPHRELMADTVQPEMTPEIENTVVTPKGKLEDLVQLQATFKKNGYTYIILERNDKVALMEMLLGGKRIGLEVCKIRISEGEISGKLYPKRETLPSDNQFGTEGSRSYFPSDIEIARKYYMDLTSCI